MLLDLEGLVYLLESDRDIDVERLGSRGGLLVVLAIGVELRVVGVLYIATCILTVGSCIDTLLDELLVQLLHEVEFTRQVDHRARLTALVNEVEGRNACSTCHEGIIGTKRRGDVYDTRTILGRYVVARNNAESLLRGYLPLLVRNHLHGLYPGNQLLVAHADEIRTLVLAHHAVGDEFVTRLVILQFEICGLRVEVILHEILGQDHRDLLARVTVEGLDGHVVDLRAYAEGRVRGQRPGGRRPGDEVGCTPLGHLGLRIDHLELRHHRRILHVAVATRLVQLVRRETRTGSGGVGLNRVTLIQQALLVELLEHPPQGLDVLVVVGDVGVLHIDPVAHLAREILPHARELHHRLAAGAVVLLDRNGLADGLLRDAELLLYAQLHRQTVRIPTRLAVHLEALLRLVAAEDILDRASHDVVNTRHTVGRGGTLKEDKRGVSLAGRETLFEGVVLVPTGEHLIGNLG